MPKDTRDKVTLSPEAFKALEVEAMLHGDSLKDTASKLILKAACPKCKEILDIMARSPKGTKEEEPKGESDNGLKGPLAQVHNDAMSQVPNVTSPQEPNVPIAQGTKGERAQRPKDTLSQGPEVMQPQEQKVTMSQEPKGDMTKGPKGPKAKGHKLSQDPIALAKLKELYGLNPRPSLVVMGKELGYSKSTVADNIKRLRERGELE